MWTLLALACFILMAVGYDSFDEPSRDKRIVGWLLFSLGFVAAVVGIGVFLYRSL